MRAATVCSAWGCPNLAQPGAEGRCAQHRRRAGSQYRRLAKATVARAAGRCEGCGQPSSKLSAHHVRALVTGAPEMVSQDELLAYCPACQQRANPQTPRSHPIG